MSTTRARTVRDRRWWALWGLMALSAAGFAVASLPPYLSGDAAAAPLPLNPDVALHYLSLAVHAVPGGLALALWAAPVRQAPPRPPAQGLHPRHRPDLPDLHRGRASAAAAVNAGDHDQRLLGPGRVLHPRGGVAVHRGHGLPGCIRRGEVQLHRIWMIRNYAPDGRGGHAARLPAARPATGPARRGSRRSTPRPCGRPSWATSWWPSTSSSSASWPCWPATGRACNRYRGTGLTVEP